MTIDAWLTLGILVGLFALLVWGRFPTWVVFVAALALIVTLGIADVGEAFQGFSHTGVLTVVVLYAVAAGMYATGAILIIADKFFGRPATARQANRSQVHSYDDHPGWGVPAEEDEFTVGGPERVTKQVNAASDEFGLTANGGEEGMGLDIGLCSAPAVSSPLRL